MSKGLFALLWIVVFSNAAHALSDSQKELIKGKLDLYVSGLKESHEFLTRVVTEDLPQVANNDAWDTSLISGQLYSACPNVQFGQDLMSRGSELGITPVATYPLTGLTYDQRFKTSVRTDESVVKFKTGFEVSLEEMRLLQLALGNGPVSLVHEAGKSIVDIWEQNLNSPDSDELWQYFGTAASGSTIFHPGFDWAANGTCETDPDLDYDPRYRPWYVSGASAQKNIVILFDLSSDVASDPDRIALQYQTFNAILGTLSHFDYVNVIYYDSGVTEYNNVLVQATAENLDALRAFTVDYQNVRQTTGNLAAALEATFDMILRSENDSSTSNCHTVVTILSSGSVADTRNSASLNRIPSAVLKDSKYSSINPIIFAAVYSLNNTNQGYLDFAELTCSTNGDLIAVNDNQGALHVVESMNDIMASFTYNEKIRWSQPYEDALGLGTLITGSLPVYLNNTENGIFLYGVVSVDVPISTILNQTGMSNVTTQDIENYLVEEQECPALDIDKETLKKLQSELTCNINAGARKGEIPIEKHKGWFAFASVVVVMFCIVYPMFMVFVGSDNAGQKDCFTGGGLCISGLMFVFGLWFLIVFWAGLYPEILKNHEWKATVLTTERFEDNPYRCCNIVNCQCSNTGAESCSAKLNKLEEGECNAGYHCCRKTCYRCRCRSYTRCSGSGKSRRCSTRTRCSRCCRCVTSVHARRCESRCGTCWNAAVTVSFVDDQGIKRNTLITKQCGRDNRGCVDSFFAGFGEIGSKRKAYYNPYNTAEVTTSVGYSGVLAATIVPAVIMILMFAIPTCVYIWRVYKSCDCESQRQKWNTWVENRKDKKVDDSSSGTRMDVVIPEYPIVQDAHTSSTDRIVIDRKTGSYSYSYSYTSGSGSDDKPPVSPWGHMLNPV